MYQNMCINLRRFGTVLLIALTITLGFYFYRTYEYIQLEKVFKTQNNVTLLK